jgi:hypothetical protein
MPAAKVRAGHTSIREKKMGTGHLRALCAIVFALTAIAATPSGGATVFINEVDYDQPGSPDMAEFVEIAGSFGASLGGWKVEFVNSANLVYATVNLPNFTFPNFTNTGWGFFVLGRPPVGPQQMLPNDDFLLNGSPAGIRLLDPGFNVIDYVSYDGLLPGATQIPQDTGAGSIAKTGPTSGPNSGTWVFAPSTTPHFLNGGEDLIPEPAGLPVLLAGAAALLRRRRRRAVQ